MGKKVIVISASPRKGGNSDILCDEFIKGAIEAGNEAEKIFLREKEIKFCTGCGYCNINDYTECATNDDMAEILKKILEADVIVLSTPIYFYSMSGQMKTFIDRTCAVYTRIVNKDFYFIMTAAYKTQEAFQYAQGDFRGFLSCLKDPHEKGSILAAGVWQKNDILNTDYPKQAYEMGKSI